MTRPFDPTRPVQTRDGRPARILATDLNAADGRYIVFAAASEITALREVLGCRLPNGRFENDGVDRPGDLINIPTKREGWVNVYRRRNQEDEIYGYIYPTQKNADDSQSVSTPRLACVRIEWEE